MAKAKRVYAVDFANIIELGKIISGSGKTTYIPCNPIRVVTKITMSFFRSAGVKVRIGLCVMINLRSIVTPTA